jgi:hypothetical protein
MWLICGMHVRQIQVDARILTMCITGFLITSCITNLIHIKIIFMSQNKHSPLCYED